MGGLTIFTHLEQSRERFWRLENSAGDDDGGDDHAAGSNSFQLTDSAVSTPRHATTVERKIPLSHYTNRVSKLASERERNGIDDGDPRTRGNRSDTLIGVDGVR